MATCIKCGSELRPGAKFCTKCGTKVEVAQSEQKAMSGVSCPQCGKALKPGAKFCTSCGFHLEAMQQSSAAGQQQMQAVQKGWLTDGVRAVANFVTGGQLNRDIQQEQQAAVRQQARVDQVEIREAQQAQQNAEREAVRAEREASRQRDRRNSALFNGAVDVVQGKAIWNIQQGELARKIKQSELAEVEKLKGVIIDEGCTAIVFADGVLVSALSAGNYLFYKSHEEEKAAIKRALEQAESELSEKERKAKEEKKQSDPTFREIGVFGMIGQGVRSVGRLLFGEKKDEKKEKVVKRKTDFARIVAKATTPPVLSVYIISERYATMTFAGETTNDGGIAFKPYRIPTRLFDIEVAVSLQLKLTDVRAVATNYLADSNSLTTTKLQQLLSPSIEAEIRSSIRNIDYEQTGLPFELVKALKDQVQRIINSQLHGIECTSVLQITDNSADFERFRSVERELYCTEKELDYLQRTGEFRNRLTVENNKQTIQAAATEEDLRYALQQINKDKMLHDDELEQFVMEFNAQKRLREARSVEDERQALLDLKRSALVKDDDFAQFTLLLNAEKRIREAKSLEEERQAYLDLKRSGLLKDEDFEVFKDQLAQNKLNRDSISEILRIQTSYNVSDARIKAEWAFNEMKEDHEFEREDLIRRRNWGIEDETREREWRIEEQQLQRDDVLRNRNWTIEDEARRREWTIEDEARGRKWSIEDQENERRRREELSQTVHQDQMTDVKLNTARKLDDYKFDNRSREDDYTFSQRSREDDYQFNKDLRQQNVNFAHMQQQRDSDWQEREREMQARRYDEQTAYERQRQNTMDAYNMQRQAEMDKADILERKQRGAMAMMAAMNEQDRQNKQTEGDIAFRQQAEQNRAAEARLNIQSIADVEKARIQAQTEMNRDNVEAGMSDAQLWAKRGDKLSVEAQVEFARNSGAVKELEAQKQILEMQQQMLNKEEDRATREKQEMLDREQRDYERYQEDKKQQQAFMENIMKQYSNDDKLMKAMEMMQQGMLGAAGANLSNMQNQYNQSMSQQQAMFNMQQQHSQDLMNMQRESMNYNMQHQQQRYEDQVQRANEYRQDAYRQQDRMDAQNQVAMGSMAQINTAVAGNLYTQSTNTNVNIQQPQGYAPQQYGHSAGKTCPQCGSPVEMDGMFCGECGYRF